MKSLKFAPELVPLIQSGEKVSTWRLWDDKDLQTGDHVQFIDRATMSPFAEATLTDVISKKMGDITEADKVGHEAVGDKVHMYELYSNYYNRPVDAVTPVKIIHFRVDTFL